MPFEIDVNAVKVDGTTICCSITTCIRLHEGTVKVRVVEIKKYIICVRCVTTVKYFKTNCYKSVEFLMMYVSSGIICSWNALGRNLFPLFGFSTFNVSWLQSVLSELTSSTTKI